MVHSNSQTDVLHRISHRTTEFLRSLRPALIPYHIEPPPTLTSKHTLPYPSPIAAVLIGKGVTPHLAELTSRAYLRSALSLKRDYEHHIQHVSRVMVETSAIPSSSVSAQLPLLYATFTSHYQESLIHMVQEIIALVQSKTVVLAPKNEKRSNFKKVCSHLYRQRSSILT